MARLQDALNRLGFDAGPADGEFGARTATAVRAFQSSVGLRATGVPTTRLLALATAQDTHDAAPARSEGSTAASFDYDRATKPDERAICTSPDLMKRDATLSRRYRATLSQARLAGAAAIRRAEHQWWLRREQCGSDIGCLRAVYDERIAEFGGSGTPDSGPVTAAAIDANDAGTVPAQAPRITGTEDFELTKRFGRPVVSQDRLADPTGQKGLVRLMALEAIKADPTVLDDMDHAKDLAYQVLAEDERARVLVSGYWAGADEFVQRDTYRQFAEEWKKRGAAAPTLPLDMIAVTPAKLGAYTAGGFPIALQAGGDSIPFPGVGPLSIKSLGLPPLPQVWHIGQARARSIPGMLNQYRGVWLARDFSLDALTVEANHYSAAATITLQRIRIFADAGLTRLLEELPLPVPPSMLDVPVRNGHVLVSGFGLRDENYRRTARFFDLLQLGAKPEAIKSDADALVFARGLPVLTDDARYVTPYNHWVGKDEFEKAENAKRFQTEKAAKLAAEAPHPPIPVTMVVTASLATYDVGRNVFPIHKTGSIYQLPSFSDRHAELPFGMTLPAEWKVDPKTAEAAAAKTEHRYVFFAVSGVITGVEPPAGNSAFGAVMRFRLDDITLYADKTLKVPITHFPVPKLLQSYLMAGTTPKPAYVPYLGEDPVMMFAAKTVPAVLDTINWQKLMEARANEEAGLYLHPETWFDNDPWPPFFPPSYRASSSTAERFKAWSKERAAAMPAVTRIGSTGTISASEGKRPLALLADSYGAIWYSQTADTLAKAGVDRGRASVIDNSYGSVTPFLVYPTARKNYVMTLTDAEVAKVQGHAVRFETTLKMSGARLAGGALLVDAEPQQVVVTDTASGKTLFTRSLTDVPGKAEKAEAARKAAMLKVKQQQEAAKAAEARKQVAAAEARQAAVLKARERPADPFGPAVAGVRLGMPLKQADAAIRAFMPVGAIAAPDPRGWGYVPTLLSRVVYSVTDMSRRVAVFSHSGSGGRVLGVTLWTRLPNGSLSRDQLRTSLEKRYGTALRSDYLAWYAGMGNVERLSDIPSLMACRGQSYGSESGYAYSEGRIDPRYIGNDRPDVLTENTTTTLPSILNGQGTLDRLSQIIDCPALLWADFSQSRNGAGFVVGLVDAGWTAQIVAAAHQQQASKDASAVDDALTPGSGPAATVPSAPEVASGTTTPGRMMPRTILPGAAAPGTETGGAQADLDILGIRLGMPFAEAEAIVRKHMTVGRTAAGARTLLKNGPPQLYQSGKLFISGDGRELIALYDEPPGAKEIVVAIWRRVYLPVGAADLATVARQLADKYGRPSVAIGGTVELWGSSLTPGCQTAYLTARNRPLPLEWAEGGKPLAWTAPNGAGPAASGYVLVADPTRPDQLLASCGPVLEAVLLAQAGGPPMEVIETILTDNSTYLTLFARAARSGASNATIKTSTPPLKF
jgi:peptidoglycan hydrolase-like protein with peptidoglycan-binding domain